MPPKAPPKLLPKAIIRKTYEVVAQKPRRKRGRLASRARKAITAPRRRNPLPPDDDDREDLNPEDNDNPDNVSLDDGNPDNSTLDPDYDNDDEPPLQDPFSDRESSPGVDAPIAARAFSRQRIRTTGSEGPARKRSKPAATAGVQSSSVWQYFTRIDKDTAQCNDCDQTMSVNTGSIGYHAQKHNHFPKNSSTKIRNLSIKKSEKTVLDDKLINWIVNDFQSFRVVSNVFFQQYTGV